MCGLWSLLCALCFLPFGGAVPATPSPTSADAPFASFNWSGYVLSGPRGSIRGVQGSWIVQRVHPEPNDTYSAEWVGVDGFSGGGLIQTGTESDSIKRVPTYDAWVELATPGERLLSMSVRPGDVMAATLVEDKTGRWMVTLRDVTRHERYSATVDHPTSDTSAEWIEERPVLSYARVSSLANLSYFQVARFGRRYTGSLPDAADVRRAIGATAPTTLRAVEMLLVPGPLDRVALDHVGALEDDGASFAVTRTKPFASGTTGAVSPTTTNSPVLRAGVSDCILLQSAGISGG